MQIESTDTARPATRRLQDAHTHTHTIRRKMKTQENCVAGKFIGIYRRLHFLDDFAVRTNARSARIL